MSDAGETANSRKRLDFYRKAALTVIILVFTGFVFFADEVPGYAVALFTVVALAGILIPIPRNRS